jgi:hypothetical protein
MHTYNVYVRTYCSCSKRVWVEDFVQRTEGSMYTTLPSATPSMNYSTTSYAYRGQYMHLRGLSRCPRGRCTSGNRIRVKNGNSKTKRQSPS